MRTVHILLPVHNRREVTIRFAKALAGQTYPRIHLILIDDGSTDGTSEAVMGVFPQPTVLGGAGSWWWAGSLQQGLDWLRAHRVAPDDVVLMTNDDAIIEPDFVQKGVDALDRHGGLVQASIYSLDGTRVLGQGIVFDESRLVFYPARSSEEVNCLTTNGLFCSWADLQQIGDFFPRLLPHYLSDYEYTIRAHRRGLRLSVGAELILRWDQENSGYKAFTGDSYRRFLAKLFSKKCPMNPVYRTSFVLLSCPWRFIPLHLGRIWFDAARLLLREARVRLSPQR